MPPKKPQQPSSPTASSATPTPQHQDITQQLEELKKIISGYGDRFDKLEKLLKEAKEENNKLKKDQEEVKKTLAERDSEILELRERLNNQEQYIRGWSIRVLNMQLPDDVVSDPRMVMQHVYRRLLLPIFQAAVATGQLNSIPEADAVLETAHVLPAKPNTVPAIICRFYTRNLRSLVFRLKKDHAPRLEPESAGQRERQKGAGKFVYPFFEDLTRTNFSKLRAISQHESVHACWSINGSLRYRLKDDDTVRRVKSVFASVDEIIGAR